MFCFSFCFYAFVVRCVFPNRKWRRNGNDNGAQRNKRKKRKHVELDSFFPLSLNFFEQPSSPANSPQNHDLNAFRAGVDVRKIVPLLTTPRTGWRLGSRMAAPSSCWPLATAATRTPSSGFLDDTDTDDNDVAGVVVFVSIIRARPGATLRALSGLATPREASCDARVAVPA